MYIKNISQILNLKGETKPNLSKDSLISAKVLSISEGKGVVQLQNGAILSSVFLVDEGIEDNKIYRFKVKEYTDEKIILEILGKEEQGSSKKSDTARILENLNISRSEGSDIISKLIKFNIPARDENILNIYNNHNFLKEIRSLSDTELLNLINNLTGKTLNADSKEFLALKNILAVLNKVDLDFLTFLEQNKIPATIENMLKVNEFMDKPLLLNEFMSSVQSLNSEKMLSNLNINSLDDSALKNLSTQLGLSKDSIKDVLTFITENNIDLNNISEKDKNTILSMISKDGGKTNLNQKFDSLINSLKNFSLLGNLSLNDDALSEKIINSIKDSTGQTLSKDVVKEVALALKDNPSLVNALRSTPLESSDFLKVAQNITKNPSLQGDSPEVIILKEFAKGNFDEILNMKYSNTNRLESFILKSLMTNSFNTASPKDFLGSKLASMGLSLEMLKDNPELMSKLPSNMLSLINENIDINKYLTNNYTMLNFNFFTMEHLYKNNIIIKNKHSSKYIDINDVKLYISVDTKNLGLVEGYVSKKFNDIVLNLKVDKPFISTVKNNIKSLQQRLSDMGYNIVNVSIESAADPATILSLSDFFNDGDYSDLDVRV